MTRLEKLEWWHKRLGDKWFIRMYAARQLALGAWSVFSLQAYCFWLWNVRRRNPVTGLPRTNGNR